MCRTAGNREYDCLCNEGWTGDFCEVKLCSDETFCQHGGICTLTDNMHDANDSDRYVCDCSGIEWEGDLCDVPNPHYPYTTAFKGWARSSIIDAFEGQLLVSVQNESYTQPLSEHVPVFAGSMPQPHILLDAHTGMALNDSRIYLLNHTKSKSFFHASIFDHRGRIVTCGNSQSPVDGSSHFFVAKFDSPGNAIWTRNLSLGASAPYNQHYADAKRLVVDHKDNVFTLTAKPSAATEIHKLDAESGALVWSSNFMPENAYNVMFQVIGSTGDLAVILNTNGHEFADWATMLFRVDGAFGDIVYQRDVWSTRLHDEYLGADSLQNYIVDMKTNMGMYASDEYIFSCHLVHWDVGDDHHDVALVKYDANTGDVVNSEIIFVNGTDYLYGETAFAHTYKTPDDCDGSGPTDSACGVLLWAVGAQVSDWSPRDNATFLMAFNEDDLSVAFALQRYDNASDFLAVRSAVGSRGWFYVLETRKRPGEHYQQVIFKVSATGKHVPIVLETSAQRDLMLPVYLDGNVFGARSMDSDPGSLDEVTGVRNLDYVIPHNLDCGFFQALEDFEYERITYVYVQTVDPTLGKDPYVQPVVRNFDNEYKWRATMIPSKYWKSYPLQIWDSSTCHGGCDGGMTLCFDAGTSECSPRGSMRHECICREGFAGRFCDQRECADPGWCGMNAKSCRLESVLDNPMDTSKYVCTCMEGYQGTHCNISVELQLDTPFTTMVFTNYTNVQVVDVKTMFDSDQDAEGEDILLTRYGVLGESCSFLAFTRACV